MHVEHFMTKVVVTCDVLDTLEHVAGLMKEKGVGSVVVLRDGKCAGIVTDRQIVTQGLAEGVGVSEPIEEIMTPDPARLGLSDNIFSAIDTLRSAGVARRAPVVDENNQVLGIVSISDISVIARDLIDAVLLEEEHHALDEARVLTGAKRMVKDIRRPTKLDRLPPEQETGPVTTPSPPGPPGESGGAGAPPRSRGR